MLKKIAIVLFMILLVVGLCSNVQAADKHTATSSINGVTATWEYELNDSNEVVYLVCKNPTDLSGKLVIPSSIDGKPVRSLGYHAFENATGLTSIEVPASLTDDCSGFPFEGCSNITEVKFEDGIQKIPGNICGDLTGITEVTMPNSVTDVGFSAFDGCSNLANINWSENINHLGLNAFQDCKSLTRLEIPKSLYKSCGNHPFEGCSNITEVKFEDGIPEIPGFICEDLTGITEVTIPDSAKEIGGYAFDGCTKLANVDFGNGVEILHINAFQDCTSLTSLKFPKSLSRDCGNHPFEGCSNITKVEFEDGITQIPSFICEDLTGLTDFNIPDSVTRIGGYAFKGCSSIEKDIVMPVNTVNIGIEAFTDCPKIKKVTFLGDIKNMGWGEDNDAAGDSIFKNHNSDLTFYCYEGSVPAKYAINFNIKYEYIPKTGSNPTNTNTNIRNTNNTNYMNNTNTNVNNNNTRNTNNANNTNSRGNTNLKNNTTQPDNTTASGILPKTGSATVKVFIFVVIAVVGTVSYKRYREINKYL